MLTYLHDIRNKLTLISGHTAILAKKYGEEDFLPLKTNIARINDLVNDAYIHIKEERIENFSLCTTEEFIKKMDLMTEAIQLLFPIEFKNEISSYNPHDFFHIAVNTSMLFQVIENAVDNSVKANATKIMIRLFESGNNCVFELVDNGSDKAGTKTRIAEVSSIIPHGIGKEIMMLNMSKMNGKIDWTRRIDHSGMIVRLYFPKKSHTI